MRIFCFTLALIFSLTTTNAATIILDLFEGAGGDGVEITATISDAPNNGVDIILRNDSTIAAVVTTLAIQDSTGLITLQPLNSLDWEAVNSLTIPGASNIGFDTTFGFKPAPPPTRNGLNEGDELTIMLMDADLNEIIRALNSGEMAIAIHVQSIGDAAISSSYVTRKITPEPSVAMMLGLAGVCMILLRKRVSR